VHLVDTNVLSELARKMPQPAVLRWFERREAFAVSVISVEELAYGIARAEPLRRTRLAAWYEAMLEVADRVLEVTPAIARAAGELRAGRDAAGRPVAQADMLIAATALVHGLTLATRKVSDFAGCGVVVVNPFEP
jgi:predicted nucleic acid-binding protein